MRRQHLRLVFSSQEQTREAVRASHEVYEASQIAIAQFLAAQDASLRRIRASHVAIAESREVMLGADALLPNGMKKRLPPSSPERETWWC